MRECECISREFKTKREWCRKKLSETETQMPANVQVLINVRKVGHQNQSNHKCASSHQCEESWSSKSIESQMCKFSPM